MENSNVLVGTWKLNSFELRLKDGSIVYPWGKAVMGQVIYGADGYMSGCLMQSNRSNVEVPDIMAGTPPEFEAAMKSYIGYAGTYSLQDNRVTHHATVSLFPNWTGTDIDRFFAIEGDLLTLSTTPAIFGGVIATAVSIWEKLPPRNI